MHTQYQHERQVKVTITRYHQEAINAEQLRLARGTPPDRIAPLAMRLRAAIATIGMRLRHQPAVAQDPVAVPTLTDAPAKSTVVI